MSKNFYLQGCAATADGGIYTYQIEANLPVKLLGFTPLESCDFLCFSRDHRRAYSTGSHGKNGFAASLSVNADGTMQMVNEVPSQGSSTCFVALSPQEKHLFTANYMTGSVSEFALNPDGSIAQVTQLVQHSGVVGPRIDRQDMAHPHCTILTPEQRFLCVCDLGLDTIFLYQITTGDQIDVANVKRVRTAPGDGPRHILFAPNGKIAYVINELSNSVSTYQYTNGNLTLLDSISTLPDGFQGQTKAAAIRFAPDGRFLYASNRGYDSIAVFKIADNGLLQRIQIIDSAGKSPRDINFLPERRFLAAANEFSNSVTFFEQNPQNGTLRLLEQQLTLSRPLYATWF